MTSPVGGGTGQLIIPIEQIAWLADQALASVGATITKDAGGGNVAKYRDAVITATAITQPESKGNALAHNTNAKTGDDSYGLWQINMLGAMGPRRRILFGITSNDKLLDPMTNAQAMAKLFLNKGRSFSDWSTFKNGAYKAHIGAATAAYNNMRPFAQVQGQVDVIVGGELAKAASAIFGPVFDFIKQIGLRIAGFVGGGLLLIVAIVLYVRSQQK
jgi:hypothetical protein